uniref:Uncharacterized protein n=1 Tax=Anguilla anguilla TaxID=7936 RepID=A0A0E9WYW5_ANGAN
MSMHGTAIALPPHPLPGLELATSCLRECAAYFAATCEKWQLAPLVF